MPRKCDGIVLKKDGTPDMRYKSSRATGFSASSGASSRGMSRAGGDGLHYRKDGQLDMRYSSSHRASPSAGQRSMPSYSSRDDGLHYRKDGQLDMRFSSSHRASSSSGQRAMPSYSSRDDGLHYRKDGQLDMRYSSSHRASPSSAQPTRPSYSSRDDGLHYRKDGQLDMRFSSSHRASSSSGQRAMPSHSSRDDGPHYRKDGQLDMRFKSSRDFLGTPRRPGNSSSAAGETKMVFPSYLPLTRNNRPDRRFKIARQYLEENPTMGARIFAEENHRDGRTDGSIPDHIPCKKDGSPDLRYKAAREFVAGQRGRSSHLHTIDDFSVLEEERAPRRRPQYWAARCRNSEFVNELLDAIQYQPSLPLPVSPLPGSVGVSMAQDPNPLHGDSLRAAMPNRLPEITDIKSRLENQESLGKGAFGEVYKSRYNNQDVAVKSFHVPELTKSGKRMFQKEIQVMIKMQAHPNAVKVLAYSIKPPAIVMEYISMGSLRYLLHCCDDATIEAQMTLGRIKQRIVMGIADFMKQLHAFNILHRDLKPDNVLITKDYTAKVADYGISYILGTASLTSGIQIKADDSSCGGIAGTSAYMAPELLNREYIPAPSSDVYSFGILLNEVVIEEEPYSDMAGRFARGDGMAVVRHAAAGHRPRMSENISTELRELIHACWNKDPSKRPSFEYIVDYLAAHKNLLPNSEGLDETIMNTYS